MKRNILALVVITFLIVVGCSLVPRQPEAPDGESSTGGRSGWSLDQWQGDHGGSRFGKRGVVGNR